MSRSKRRWLRWRRRKSQAPSVFRHLDFHIPPDFRLAAEAVRIFHDSHVLLTVIPRAQVLHALAHLAHAGGAETVSATGMFHGNTVIQGNVQECLPFGGLDGPDLTGVVESDAWHAATVSVCSLCVWEFSRNSAEILHMPQLLSVYSSRMSLLRVSHLRVAVDGREILHGLDLCVRPGEVHAIMGPNGSGKSTLVHALMGHPKYVVTEGSAEFLGKDLLAMEPHERALAGLFLAFQYPKEIVGVTLRGFLFAAYKAQMQHRHASAMITSPIKFQRFLAEKMQRLHMDPALAERSLNQGFSGGEKKKAEILQLQVLSPLLAMLDETDSGLDVDALRIVAEGVQSMRSPEFSAIIVTHYARILEYLTPDYVHVMVRGRIVRSGGAELAHTLEREGYASYGVDERDLAASR